MQYLVLLHFPPGAGPQEGTPEYDAEMRRWGELNDELREAGVVLGASGLRVDATTTLRAPGGDVTVTDGPTGRRRRSCSRFTCSTCRTSTPPRRGRRRCRPPSTARSRSAR